VNYSTNILINSLLKKRNLFLFIISSANIVRNRQGFNDAIVFMIGGGNYIEYQNLQDYAKTRSQISTKRIVYGCTELVNASQFLEQVKRKIIFDFYELLLDFFLAGKIGSINELFYFSWVIVVNKLF